MLLSPPPESGLGALSNLVARCDATRLQAQVGQMFSLLGTPVEGNPGDRKQLALRRYALATGR